LNELKQKVEELEVKQKQVFQEEYEKNHVENESYSFTLESLNHDNSEFTEDFEKFIKKTLQSSMSESQPADINKEINYRATAFRYVIGSTKWVGNIKVIPLVNKDGGYKIYNRTLGCSYSSFFLPNGIEIMFFDSCEEQINEYIGNDVVYSFLGILFKTYNDANVYRLLSYKNIDFIVYDRIATGYVNKNPKKQKEIDELTDDDTQKEATLKYALENGYKENNKKWGCVEIEPIPYSNGRIGFKFKENGIIVLYCSDRKTIFISPNNKNEFDSYRDAYAAFENKEYTGLKRIFHNIKKFYEKIKEKLKIIKESMYNTYSSIIKYTGGLLIDSARKIRAIYMIPYNVNYSVRIATTLILATYVYYNFDYYHDIGQDLYNTYFPPPPPPLTPPPFNYENEWRKFPPQYPMTKRIDILPSFFNNQIPFFSSLFNNQTVFNGGAQNKKKYLQKYLKYKHKYLQLK